MILYLEIQHISVQNAKKLIFFTTWRGRLKIFGLLLEWHEGVLRGKINFFLQRGVAWHSMAWRGIP